MLRFTLAATVVAAFTFTLSVAALAQRGGRGGAANSAEATEFQDFAEETNLVRKAQLREAFIEAHRGSSFRPQIDQFLADAYGKSQDWAKVIATAERLQRQLTGGSAQSTAPLFTSALLAALRMNDMSKALQFGELLTAGDPNDINPYQILASAIPERLTEDAVQRAAALNLALDYARKGIALQRPLRVAEADWNGAQLKLHFAPSNARLKSFQRDALRKQA